MEFKGTEGNWEVSRCQISEKITISSGLFCVADVFCYDVLCGTNDIEEAYYNALLISKAPEMLEMLKEIQRRVSIIISEPNGIVKDTMIHNLDLGIEQLIKEATQINNN